MGLVLVEIFLSTISDVITPAEESREGEAPNVSTLSDIFLFSGCSSLVFFTVEDLFSLSSASSAVDTDVVVFVVVGNTGFGEGDQREVVRNDDDDESERDGAEEAAPEGHGRTGEGERGAEGMGPSFVVKVVVVVVGRVLEISVAPHHEDAGRSEREVIERVVRESNEDGDEVRSEHEMDVRRDIDGYGGNGEGEGEEGRVTSPSSSFFCFHSMVGDVMAAAVVGAWGRTSEASCWAITVVVVVEVAFTSISVEEEGKVKEGSPPLPSSPATDPSWFSSVVGPTE